jgi:hypothetical protein
MTTHKHLQRENAELLEALKLAAKELRRMAAYRSTPDRPLDRIDAAIAAAEKGTP